MIECLAACSAGNVLALCALLASGNADALPCPFGAAAATAENVDVCCRARDCAGDSVDGQIGDWNTGGGSAGWASVLVILLDDDTVFCDTGQSNVLVGNTGDGSGITRDGLDAYTVLGVGDGRA